MENELISIIMPLLHTPMNDQAMEIVQQTLEANTVGPWEMIIDDDDERDMYEKVNRLADKANSDNLCFWNSDVFPAPNWDVMMRKHHQPNAITTGYLCECGAIGVATENVPANFGWRPESYDRKGFEAFALEHSQNVPEVREKRAWYFPCMISRERFVELGKFKKGVWNVDPVDIWFWNHHAEQGGIFLQTRSYFYHLQCLSATDRVDRSGK